MKKTIAMQWVRALRSGRYQKGTQQLYNPMSKTYCCLGVLCDISFVGDWKLRFDDRYATYVTDSGEVGAILPEEVKKWAGMDTKTGLLPRPYKKAEGLIELNDRVVDSFDEIADYIEKYYRDL